MSSLSLRNVSWRQIAAGLWSFIKIESSSKLGFRPQQFHWIIVSIVHENIKKNKKLKDVLDQYIIK